MKLLLPLLVISGINIDDDNDCIANGSITFFSNRNTLNTANNHINDKSSSIHLITLPYHDIEILLLSLRLIFNGERRGVLIIYIMKVINQTTTNNGQ